MTLVLLAPSRGCNDAHVIDELKGMKMRDLLATHPQARAVLQSHGVDPMTRCHSAALNHMTLKQVLGRTCPVDNVEETFADLAGVLEAALST